MRPNTIRALPETGCSPTSQTRSHDSCANVPRPCTPLGSSGLHVQELDPFHGLRQGEPDSAPSGLLAETKLSTRRASVHAVDRSLAPPEGVLDPALRRSGLPKRRRAATRVSWCLLWPDLQRLVIVSFRTRLPHFC